MVINGRRKNDWLRNCYVYTIYFQYFKKYTCYRNILFCKPPWFTPGLTILSIVTMLIK